MTMFEVGDEVKVVGTLSGHQIPVGTRLTVVGYQGMFVRVQENAMNYYEQDLELQSYNKERLQQRLAKKENEFLKLKSQMEYLEETGLDSIDKQAFQDYVILKLLADPHMALQEKSRRIKALFEK